MLKQFPVQFKCDLNSDLLNNERLNTLLFRVQAYINLGHHNMAKRYATALARQAKRLFKDGVNENRI